MRAFTYMFAGILFACAIAQPAVAGALTQADIDFVFDPAAGYTVDGLIPLSPEEMDQIEGQYWALYWRRIARAVQGFYHSIQRGVTFSVGRFTYKIFYDRSPHKFGPEWKALQGNRPHWQVNRWATGVKDSTRTFRLPWGAKQPPGKYPKGHRGGRKKGEPRQKGSGATPLSALLAMNTDSETSTPTPSDWLVQVLLQEMPDDPELSSSSDSGGLILLTNADGSDDGSDGGSDDGSDDDSTSTYTGPMPTERLRGLIFQYTEPTRAEVCRWVGGLNC